MTSAGKPNYHVEETLTLEGALRAHLRQPSTVHQKD